MEGLLMSLITFYYLYIIALGIYMFLLRKRAVENNEIRLSYFKTYSQTAPEYLNTIKNHFSNQFEVPLFWALISSIALVKESVTLFTLTVSILFVVSRLAHSWIHLKRNDVFKRALCYFSGLILVLFLCLERIYIMI